MTIASPGEMNSHHQHPLTIPLIAATAVVAAVVVACQIANLMLINVPFGCFDMGKLL